MIKLILEITPNNLFKSKKSERSPQIIRKRICVKKNVLLFFGRIPSKNRKNLPLKE
jgi:hypothetical protein